MDFKQEVIKLLKQEAAIAKLNDIPLEIPPDQSLGNYAFPCFVLAKEKKKSPVDIAKELAEKIKPSKAIEKITATGPYLNFFVKKESLSADILPKILKEKERYGTAKSKKKTYLMEYFHANTHKGVHIGHIRNISMAEALCRILENDGYKVIRTNYQGDIGPHVAKCLWGYIHLKEKEPKTKKGMWLGKIYSLANKKARDNESITEEIKQINNKIYAKDKELTALWEKTRKYCLDDFENFYKEFGVKFDRLYFESEVEAPGKDIVNDMLKKGTAEKSDGAIIINLEKYNLGVYVLLTQEGNALYSTKDLGLAEIKSREFKFDKSIHVTGSEQVLHFNQLFKTLEINKSPMAKKSIHIPYGLVMLPEGKMSSREGTMILFDELREKLFKTAEKAIKQRHKDLSKKEIEERTSKIAYGALKFSMVNRENNKDITFDWENALDFEGETGPYVQYAHARICSIFSKHSKKVDEKADVSALSEDSEMKLISLLADYPAKAEEASRNYKPHLIARYLLDLSQQFNEFYHACPILSEKDDIKNARLVLITAVKHVLSNGLNLLGIEAPERM